MNIRRFAEMYVYFSYFTYFTSIQSFVITIIILLHFVHSYFNHRQLERETEKLRNEILLAKTGDKAAVESLQQLLASSRNDLEQSRLLTNQANKEVDKLRVRIEELQEKLSEAQGNAIRNETLAKEYSLQIQELRNRLTDDRFLQVRSKDKDESVDRYSSL